MPMITDKKLRALETKSKSGWRQYYLLLEDDFKEADRMRTILSNVPKTDDIQSLLDGLNARLTCVICLEEDLNKSNSHLNKCLHRFHKTCWDEYKESNGYKCPICRRE